MSYYLVKYNNNIIGTYDDIKLAKLFINSCYQNKFMTSKATIMHFTKNSCYFEKEEVEQTDEEKKIAEEEKKKDTEKKIEDKKEQEKKIEELHKSSEYKEITQSKIDLQHDLNLLKQRKEKIEQSKNVYESDLKLYNIFIESKKSNPDFEVPEIFVKKFTLFEKLVKENRLSWDNFIGEYKHENMYNDYFSVTYHEELYSEPKDKSTNDIKNTNEEFEIASDYASSDNE
jgi:flagellar biosynthesis GTPase FlhF